MIELPAPKYYCLIERKVVMTTDLMQWAMWFELARRSGASAIGKDDVSNAFVSTTFLGIDHNYWGGAPLLFETMVFAQEEDGSSDMFQERYATIEEAEAGHKRVVASLRKHETDAIEMASTFLYIIRKEAFAKG